MFVDDKYEQEFYLKKLVAIVDLLDYLNKDKYTKHILRHLAKCLNICLVYLSLFK